MAAQALKVAVIIPVYNTTELFLQESLDSILAQDQADLNLDIRIFIHDDGSSLPETASTLKHYQSRHPSILLSSKATNEGIVSSLNILIDLALEWGALYVARMDADDIAAPDRLARQVSHLEAHSDIFVLGGAVKMFKSGTSLVRPVEYPSSSGVVHFGLFYNCILVHPTIVFRASILAPPHNLRYQEAFKYAEDYAMWLHLVEEGHFKLDNLPNPPLLRLRKHVGNESKVHQNTQKSASRKALKTVLDRMIATYDDEPWTVSAETVDSILTGYEHQTLETITEAFKITELIEKHLISQSNIFSTEDKEKIRSESLKQLGALASMEMRLSAKSPSSLYCWKRWLSRKPAEQFSSLLGQATVSLSLSESNKQDSSSSSSQSTLERRVSVICFTKDRAFQMQEYLRTFEDYVIKSSPNIKFDIHIIYKTSTPKFSASYQSLASRFSHFHWISESNFVQHLTDVVKNAAPYILWGVDDVLYYNPTDILPILESLHADPSILCATLRLSPNVTYCHPSNGYSRLPHFTSLKSFESSTGDVKDFKQEILTFNRTEATEDWNYPFELCATIMHKSLVSDVLLGIVKYNGIDGMSHPNKLEVTGSRLFTKQLIQQSSLTTCICLKYPVLSVITVNRVQDVCENRIYNEISLDELERHFDDKREMDLEFYRSKTFDAVHIGDFVLK